MAVSTPITPIKRLKSAAYPFVGVLTGAATFEGALAAFQDTTKFPDAITYAGLNMRYMGDPTEDGVTITAADDKIELKSANRGKFGTDRLDSMLTVSGTLWEPTIPNIVDLLDIDVQVAEADGVTVYGPGGEQLTVRVVVIDTLGLDEDGVPQRWRWVLNAENLADVEMAFTGESHLQPSFEWTSTNRVGRRDGWALITGPLTDA